MQNFTCNGCSATACFAAVAIEVSSLLAKSDFSLLDFSLLIEFRRLLAVAVNNLTRSMRLSDFYPFALSDAVTDKPWFNQTIVRTAASGRGGA